MSIVSRLKQLSNKTLKFGKVGMTIDASAPAANRSMTLPDANIDFTGGSNGDVLTKISSTSIGWAAGGGGGDGITAPNITNLTFISGSGSELVLTNASEEKQIIRVDSSSEDSIFGGITNVSGQGDNVYPRIILPTSSVTTGKVFRLFNDSNSTSIRVCNGSSANIISYLEPTDLMTCVWDGTKWIRKISNEKKLARNIALNGSFIDNTRITDSATGALLNFTTSGGSYTLTTTQNQVYWPHWHFSYSGTWSVLPVLQQSFDGFVALKHINGSNHVPRFTSGTRSNAASAIRVHHRIRQEYGKNIVRGRPFSVAVLQRGANCDATILMSQSNAQNNFGTGKVSRTIKADINGTTRQCLNGTITYFNNLYISDSLTDANELELEVRFDNFSVGSISGMEILFIHIYETPIAPIQPVPMGGSLESEYAESNKYYHCMPFRFIAPATTYALEYIIPDIGLGDISYVATAGTSFGVRVYAYNQPTRAIGPLDAVRDEGAGANRTPLTNYVGLRPYGTQGTNKIILYFNTLVVGNPNNCLIEWKRDL